MNPPECHFLPEALDPVSADMERRAKRRLLWLHVATWAAPSLIGALSLGLLALTHKFFPRALDMLSHMGMFIAMIVASLAAIGAITYCGFLHAVLRCKRSGREPKQRKKQVVHHTISFVLLQATFICAVVPTLIVIFTQHKR